MRPTQDDLKRSLDRYIPQFLHYDISNYQVGEYVGCEWFSWDVRFMVKGHEIGVVNIGSPDTSAGFFVGENKRTLTNRDNLDEALAAC